MTEKKLEIVCCLRLNDALAYNYLKPLTLVDDVSRIWVVRHKKNDYAKLEKTKYIIVSSQSKLLRFRRMQYCLNRLASRPQVRAFVSFNPFPYGLFSFHAAKRWNKAVHFGFIGSDWYRDSQGSVGSLLTHYTKRVDMVTVTGAEMRSGLIRRGVETSRLHILPHSIDIERFCPRGGEAAYDYAALFIGQLIQRKCVDVIIRSFREVLYSHPRARFCIVGDGPQRSQLQELAVDLEIANAVDFVGHRHDVENFARRSRFVVIASRMEGFPYALVEGMCCGAIPISTRSGTIADYIHDGENGFLVDYNRPDQIAACICRLLDNASLRAQLRSNALHIRKEVGYQAAVNVWKRMLPNFRNTDVIGGDGR